MQWLRVANGMWAFRVLLLSGLFCGLAGCGSNAPGRMEWVQPITKAPHVGTVYLIRGWMGVFSAGIDEMARQLNERGVTAYVFQDQQYPELAAAMVERYKGMAQHEPICFIGHSRGCDSSLIISRALEKVGVNVDLIVTLDSVDEATVPRNVRVCYNYWMPGVFGDSNLLRGIPLNQEPGATGKVYNYNLDTEFRQWRGDLSDHVTMDDDPNLERLIIEHVMEVCVERSKWVPPVPITPASQR